VSEAAPLYVGLISGTSRDGADAALLRLPAGTPELVATLCLPYPDDLAAALEGMLRAGRRPAATELRGLDPRLAAHFADAAERLLAEAGIPASAVSAIGSHGQTVWHAPEGPQPESIQLGDPARIAKLTGVTTVGDFRRADLEAGGQGAPLAPLLHRALFRPERGRRVVLNLGGIANVSVLDADGGVSGCDTGPANCLLDLWIRGQRGRPFDRDGAWAAGGTVDESLLADLLADPYFARPAPKSTGLEYFNSAWLQRRLAGRDPVARDVQATLAELSAVSVADAVRASGADDVLVCGGGVHNSDLLARLCRRLPGTPVQSTASAGLDPDWVEAVLFAWLARERLAGRCQDTRSITGARTPVLLGKIFDPPAVSSV
jgi:anhydro-N-acetylmuramic acid kinase